MTIGQRKSSVRSSIRAPKFLDKSSGFYGRLDEPEISAAEDLKRQMSNGAVEDIEMFKEDDGEMLLRRKPSRRSSRWRSLRRKDSKEERKKGSKEEKRGSKEEKSQSEEESDVIIQVQRQTEERELGMVHFPFPEEADDRVLIRDRAEEQEEQEPEEDRNRREQQEGIKALQRKSSSNYRKALDRAFRRGWEAFITNLYSVTLTASSCDSSPSPCDSSPPSSKKRQHSHVLAELH